uniref:G domain-containing protein n=1 Tax=Parastrongyloides trichosuri TaxID=131310 RepID=A0A0N4ZQ29_PARTI
MIRKGINTLTWRFVILRRCNIQSHTNIKETLAKRYRKIVDEVKYGKEESVSNLKFDSIAVERYMKEKNIELFNKIKEHEENQLINKNEYNNNDLNFPMKDIVKVNFIENEPVINEHEEKGFHIICDNLVEDYKEGYVGELEVNEMTIPETTLHGPEDAVERIEFQLPGQAAIPNNNINDIRESNKVDVTKEELNIEADIQPSKKTCAGCGANFQCNHTSLPGFIPFNTFKDIEGDSYRRDIDKGNHNNLLCRRCYLLKKHKFLLNVNVSPLDYISMMGHLKMKEALILLVVDVTDLPYSIYENLPDIIGYGKPIIVIGNKVDLLPPDARAGYLKNFRNVLYKTLEDMGFKDKFNILHTALVSAKTGYGIEELITQIYLKWTNLKDTIRSDMYLIGNTNAGKSSIFNIFLQSDLCKVRAMDLIERASASPWPGTTMSLLKFPVMNLSSQKLEIRRRRLLAVQNWINKEERNMRMLLRESKDPRYATLMGVVESSFKELDNRHQFISVEEIEAGFDSTTTFNSSENENKKLFNPDDPTFVKGTWCFDTPGVINQSQLMNIFTLNELIKIFPKNILTPRTFILKANQTLLIGGIAKISSKDTSVLLTLFCSNKLPINIINTDEVEKFLKKYLGKSNLVVPYGNENRMKEYPSFDGKTFTIIGKGVEEGSCDITLSSIGWFMITSNKGQKNTITVKTPGGLGISRRDYTMLPYSVTLRGSRIGGTQEYKTKAIRIPEPLKKSRKSRFTRNF